MATFADLMSLLMCFFVLLLSFSEMDVEKFKQIAGSMSMAFGVQNQLQLDDIPRGTSVVALEFSPGETTESPVETIQQVTDQSFDNTLEVNRSELTEAEVQEMLEAKIEALLAETKADADTGQVNRTRAHDQVDLNELVLAHRVLREQGVQADGGIRLRAVADDR